MAKITKFIRFSDEFNIPANTLEKEGLLNPFLNVDTDLFIDPLLLRQSENKIINTEAVALFEKHFENIQILLSNSKEDENDIVFKQARKFLTIKDLPSTCLGYGSSSTSGRSLTQNITTQILRNSKRIVDLGIKEPKIFSLVPMISDGVGPDMISDLTSSIIKNSLIKITDYFTQKYISSSQLYPIYEKNNSYKVPYNKYNKQPVFLIPCDILRKLPIAQDWDAVMDAAQKNNELKNEVSKYIGEIWEKRSKKSKQELRDKLLYSKKSIYAYLDMLENAPKDHYDFNKDSDGNFKWKEYVDKLQKLELQNIPLTKTKSDLIAIVDQILEQFKSLIENHGSWELFYDDSKRVRKERIVQRFFLAIAKKICDENNIDISPEADSGNGEVDFKFSRGSMEKVLVEIKLSTNKRVLDGYSKQLEAYKKSENTDHGILLLVEVTGGSKNIEKKLYDLRNDYSEFSNLSKIYIVDGTIKKSASKL